MKNHATVHIMLTSAIIQVFASVSLLLLPGCSNEKDIIILYDNDVHCSTDGYSKIAHMKDSLHSNGLGTLLVSSGDYLSGGTLGSVSHGAYIKRIMNAVGYDVITLGNHEFDYGMARFSELTGQLSSEITCCNFREIPSGRSVFCDYTIKHAGSKKIGFIGVITPSTVTSSSPRYFKDSSGQWRYTFCPDSVFSFVQSSADLAKKKGADCIILLSHLGNNPEHKVSSIDVIKHTHGIDAVIDGHDHVEIAHDTVLNQHGENVLLTSSGAYFKNIGILNITSDGKFYSALLRTDSIPSCHNSVADTLDSINREFQYYAKRVIGTTDVNLTILDKSGKRRSVRREETNLGDLAADAIRAAMETDIGIINGGSLRSSIDKGEILWEELDRSIPFGNNICSGQVKGYDILDALEMASQYTPEENGGFLQVSGLKYEIDTSIPSSVETDEHEVFVKVNGRRRVKNVTVLDRKTGKYVPIGNNETYTIAGSEYLLKNNGNGLNFRTLEITESSTETDIQLIESYITSHLGGHIGSKYALPQRRITVK